MPEEHELTIRIEETKTGAYRARVSDVADRHFAKSDDPIEAARGALAAVRGRIDESVDYDRSAGPDRRWE